MNKSGIQGRLAHPVFKKMKLPLNSEHLLMGTTTKILQSLGNYTNSILTTTIAF